MRAGNVLKYLLSKDEFSRGRLILKRFRINWLRNCKTGWKSCYSSTSEFWQYSVYFTYTLYFPGCFDDDVLNKEEFLKLSPKSDDVWLKAMSLKKGTPCQKVYDERTWKLRNTVIDGSQRYALKNNNLSEESGNDSKINAVFNKYNLWHKLK